MSATNFDKSHNKESIVTTTRFNKPLKRIVVKIGSSLLTNNGRGLDRTAIYEWAKQIALIQNQGFEIVLVSSGSIAEGVVRMNLEQRPKKLPALQACAAIGQMGLIETWWSALIQYGVQSSQLLLTHDDLSNRKRYLNTANTLKQIIDWRVIPVINENDTIAVDEIKFGDNDTLGAMAAAMATADLYIILTDQQGVYTDNPRVNPDAIMISEERAMADYLFDIAGEGGKLGSGGMLTKIRAARLAAMGGCPTVIVSGHVTDVITRVVSGENIGTLLTTDESDKIIAKKQWLAAHLQTAGSLVIDDGAATAIVENHKSLLAVGIQEAHGYFDSGDVVSIMNTNKKTIAIGQVNVANTVIQSLIDQQPKPKLKSLADTQANGNNKGNSLVIVHTDEMAIVL